MATVFAMRMKLRAPVRQIVCQPAIVGTEFATLLKIPQIVLLTAVEEQLMFVATVSAEALNFLLPALLTAEPAQEEAAAAG